MHVNCAFQRALDQLLLYKNTKHHSQTSKEKGCVKGEYTKHRVDKERRNDKREKDCKTMLAIKKSTVSYMQIVVIYLNL